MKTFIFKTVPIDIYFISILTLKKSICTPLCIRRNRRIYATKRSNKMNYRVNAYDIRAAIVSVNLLTTFTQFLYKQNMFFYKIEY